MQIINGLQTQFGSLINYFSNTTTPEVSKLSCVQDIRGPSLRKQLAPLRVPDSVDSKLADAALKVMSRHPITIKETWYLAGAGDYMSKRAGTHFTYNLSEYINNPGAIHSKHFFGKMFRNSTLDECAEDFIMDIYAAYRDVPGNIELNIIGHSMGSVIATLAIKKLNMSLNGSRFKVKNFISISGANQGSPAASVTKILCCKDNILKNLETKRFNDMTCKLDGVNSLYLAAENDPIVPPGYSKVSGSNLLILNNVSSVSPHTKILNNSIVKLLVLKTIRG